MVFFIRIWRIRIINWIKRRKKIPYHYEKEYLIRLINGVKLYPETASLRTQAIALLEGKTVLDIGCGAGIDMKEMEKKGFKTKGIDVFESSINHCKKIGLDTELFSIEDFPEIKKYDSVYAWHVIEHLKKDKEAIEKMLRIANKTVVFIVPKMCQHNDHLHYYSEKDIIDLLKNQKYSSYQIIFLKGKEITHQPIFIVKIKKEVKQ